jgi:6-phosphogluconolactonase/glucosamine-6-phosphate isomerase/deaminase
MSATSTTNVAIAAVTTGTTQKQFYELLTTANTGYVAFSAEL